MSCDCGKENAARVWCYVHGYIIEPSHVRRMPKPQFALSAPASAPVSESAPAAKIENAPAQRHGTPRKCRQCGMTFDAIRKDAALCSLKCRIRASRYGNKERELPETHKTV